MDSGAFVAFRASDVNPSRLQAICSRYFAYQHAQIVRRTVTWRLFLFFLVVCLLTWGVHVLPGVAVITTAGLLAACLAVVRRIELTARRRLANELHGLPLIDA